MLTNSEAGRHPMRRMCDYKLRQWQPPEICGTRGNRSRTIRYSARELRVRECVIYCPGIFLERLSQRLLRWCVDGRAGWLAGACVRDFNCGRLATVQIATQTPFRRRLNAQQCRWSWSEWVGALSCRFVGQTIVQLQFGAETD